MTNVKQIDGEPWEVAQAAGTILDHELSRALEGLEQFEWASQNSWLSQEDYRTGAMPTADEFAGSALGLRIAKIREALTALLASVRTATAAAAFDPRSY